MRRPAWRKRIVVWVAVVTCALALRAPAASAAPIHPQARRHLDRAITLYNAGKYDEAVVELRAGLLIKEHPDLWYALGQSERARGDCVRAIDAYRAFLRSAPPPEERSRAEANIQRCEKSLLPPPRPVPVAKPQPDGARAKTPPAAPVPAPAADAGLRALGVGVFGASALLFGLGTYFTVRAGAASDDIDDAADRRALWSADLQRKYDSVDAANTQATILFVAGGATAVAGGFLFYLAQPTPPRPTASGTVPARTAARAAARTATYPGSPYPSRAALEVSGGAGKLTLRWQF